MRDIHNNIPTNNIPTSNSNNNGNNSNSSSSEPHSAAIQLYNHTIFSERRTQSPLSSALADLLNNIHSRSIEAGYASRQLRRRSRINPLNHAGPHTSHRRQAQIPDNRTISVVKNFSNESTTVNGEFPLHFDIVKSDGGDYNYGCSIPNILHNDDYVYCSIKSENINIVLKFNSGNSGVIDHSCVITGVTVKSPSNNNYTAPCTDCLLFISHHNISLEDMRHYDNFTLQDYNRCKEQPDKFPWPNSSLIPDHYFQLTLNTNYYQNTKLNHRSCRYVGLKLLRSAGTSANVDFQYICLMGYTGARSFAHGQLI